MNVDRETPRTLMGMLSVGKLAGSLTAASIILLAAACGGSGGDSRRLTIFAASSLTDAFREAARQFEEANEGTQVTLNLAATSTLLLQLEQGASADLFASADERNIGSQDCQDHSVKMARRFGRGPVARSPRQAETNLFSRVCLEIPGPICQGP